MSYVKTAVKGVYNVIDNKTGKIVGVAGGVMAAGSAMAALPTEVTTAITTAQADGSELGYALLGMAVVVGVIFWLKRKAG